MWECRQLSSPKHSYSERGDDERLKRVARYLHGHPDYMPWYPGQEETNTVVVSTDADWATCRESRRSDSGGTMQLGDHRRVESRPTTHYSRAFCWHARNLGNSFT